MFRVALGVFHLSKKLDYKKLDLPTVQTFRVNKKDFVIHEDYGWIRRDGKSTVINDIGLIKIPRDAEFNQLTQPVCWGQDPGNTLGIPVVVGWGKTNPDQLQHTENGAYSNDQLKLKVRFPSD